MQAIWKYPLETVDSLSFQMPFGAKVLCVQTQRERPCMWALIPDIEAPGTVREFSTYGTGHQHPTINGQYVGTYQLNNGALIFHVFEDTRSEHPTF